MAKRRSGFKWDVRQLLINVKAALKRAEQRPNANAEYIRALERLRDEYDR